MGRGFAGVGNFALGGRLHGLWGCIRIPRHSKFRLQAGHLPWVVSGAADGTSGQSARSQIGRMSILTAEIRSIANGLSTFGWRLGAIFGLSEVSMSEVRGHRLDVGLMVPVAAVGVRKVACVAREGGLTGRRFKVVNINKKIRQVSMFGPELAWQVHP